MLVFQFSGHSHADLKKLFDKKFDQQQSPVEASFIESLPFTKTSEQRLITNEMILWQVTLNRFFFPSYFKWSIFGRVFIYFFSGLIFGNSKIIIHNFLRGIYNV
jgi:hypothetical protein